MYNLGRAVRSPTRLARAVRAGEERADERRAVAPAAGIGLALRNLVQNHVQ
jgi:hypothetical protein